MHVDGSGVDTRPQLKPVVPAGSYKVLIDKIEDRVSRAQTPWLSVRYRILGGEYDGLLLFGAYFLDPTSEWFKENKAKLVRLMVAGTGSESGDTNTLKDKIVTVQVIKTEDKKYGVQNKVVDVVLESDAESPNATPGNADKSPSMDDVPF